LRSAVSDSGRVRLLDGDPWHDAVALHRRLAYVPGDVTLWPGISGGEAIDLTGVSAVLGGRLALSQGLLRLSRVVGAGVPDVGRRVLGALGR
jgi:hypothetical protein